MYILNSHSLLGIHKGKLRIPIVFVGILIVIILKW